MHDCVRHWNLIFKRKKYTKYRCENMTRVWPAQRGKSHARIMTCSAFLWRENLLEERAIGHYYYLCKHCMQLCFLWVKTSSTCNTISYQGNSCHIFLSLSLVLSLSYFFALKICLKKVYIPINKRYIPGKKSASWQLVAVVKGRKSKQSGKKRRKIAKIMFAIVSRCYACRAHWDLF